MTENKSTYGERLEESRNIVRNALEEIFINEEIFYGFLDIMSKFDFSAQDCLIVAETMPNASHFGTFSDWQDSGYRINKGEKGLAFIDHEKNKKSFWFDISQTNAPVKKAEEKNLTSGEKFRALLSNNRFPFYSVNKTGKDSETLPVFEPEKNKTDYTHGKAAYFDSKYKVIFRDPTVTFEEIYPALAAEMAHSYLWQALGNRYSHDRCETTAQMASYIICKRNDIEPGEITVTTDLKSVSPEQVKTVLDNVRLVADKIDNNIQYFYKNGKDKFQPPPRRIKLDESKEEMPKITKSNERKSIRDFIQAKKNEYQKSSSKYQPQHFKDDTKTKGGKI